MTHLLRIASFNAENCSLLLDSPHYTREELDALDQTAFRAMNPSIFFPNKDRDKIAHIARIIMENDFDLVGLCEIGGLETLQNINRLYLHSRYECALFEENSSRGIFVGALIKKRVFPGYTVHHVPGSFSRNVLKIDLGKKGGNLQIFLVHLKSQHGEDRGIDLRIAEVTRLAGLVRLRKCIVMGDFNGILIRGMHQFEYEPFLDLPFCDVLAAVGIPPDKRRTHYWFGPEPHFTQLDYIFCTHDIAVLDAESIEERIPATKEERFQLPSDHTFLRAIIEV